MIGWVHSEGPGNTRVSHKREANQLINSFLALSEASVAASTRPIIRGSVIGSGAGKKRGVEDVAIAEAATEPRRKPAAVPCATHAATRKRIPIILVEELGKEL